jgi:hypothetical protein
MARSIRLCAWLTIVASAACAPSTPDAPADTGSYLACPSDQEGCLEDGAFLAKASVHLQPGLLPDGTWRFVVVAPGFEHEGIVDGNAGNLSDAVASIPGDDGSGDVVEQRTFTIVNGQLAAYTGAHLVDLGHLERPTLQLIAFDDADPIVTGLHRLALCPAAGGDCLWDSFTVLEPYAKSRCKYPFADCDHIANNGCETNLSTNPNDCGGCGIVCSGNNVYSPTCAFGLCNGTCVAGWADCDHNKQTNGCEINTTGNVNNCGGCGVVCSGADATAACTNSTCVLTCNSGYADCDHNAANGCEVNVNTDGSNCGACGTACTASQACMMGTCQVVSCPTGQTVCSGTCVNLQTDNANCGTCGTSCMMGQTCCAGACVDTSSSNSNCGACGTTCDTTNHQTCAMSACSCATGYTNCGTTGSGLLCINLQNDSAHCGMCENACMMMEPCTGGVCGCPSGQTFCAQGHACTDLNTDPNNCGTCGNVCAGGCVNGTCS